jgi:hypothetical protein
VPLSATAGCLTVCGDSQVPPALGVRFGRKFGGINPLTQVDLIHCRPCSGPVDQMGIRTVNTVQRSSNGHGLGQHKQFEGHQTVGLPAPKSYVRKVAALTMLQVGNIGVSGTRQVLAVIGQWPAVLALLGIGMHQNCPLRAAKAPSACSQPGVQFHWMWCHGTHSRLRRLQCSFSVQPAWAWHHSGVKREEGQHCSNVLL